MFNDLPGLLVGIWSADNNPHALSAGNKTTCYISLLVTANAPNWHRYVEMVSPESKRPQEQEKEERKWKEKGALYI